MANEAIKVPQLSLVPPSAPTPTTQLGDAGTLEQPEERTTIAKVGIGAGAALGASLLGLGVYRLGKWAGWWGSSSIVIDDPIRPDDSIRPDDDKPKPKPKPKPDGRRASGNPPNQSGDPEGYNTKLYPSPAPVRLGFKLAGYAVALTTESLNPDLQPNPDVTRFQRDWNQVIKAIDSYSVTLPASPAEPLWLDRLRGVLDVDGIAGKNTLNALEIALTNHIKNLNWRELVKEAAA